MDADLEQLSKKCAVDTNSDNQRGHETTSFCSSERVANEMVHGDMDSNGKGCGGSSLGECDIVKESTQGSFETPLAESEQATYASANNDLKGTKAYQEADVPGLHNLAMAIIDYRGHRVVAQVKPSFFAILGRNCLLEWGSSSVLFLFHLMPVFYLLQNFVTPLFAECLTWHSPRG